MSEIHRSNVQPQENSKTRAVKTYCLMCSVRCPVECHVEKTTHVCNWHRESGSEFTYGVGMPQPDYEHAGCVLVWVTNPHNTHPRHARDIDAAVERGAKLVVIDPRRIPLAGRP